MSTPAEVIEAGSGNTRSRTTYIVLAGSQGPEDFETAEPEWTWRVVGELEAHNREQACRWFDAEQKGGVFKAVAKSAWEGSLRRTPKETISIDEEQLTI